MLPTDKPAFTPDFNKKKFEIIIEVYENSQTLRVNHIDKLATYHEVIGALDIQKNMLIYDQSTYNRKVQRAKRKKL